MKHPEGERPLDAWEAHEFEMIVRGFRRDAAPRRPVPPTAVRPAPIPDLVAPSDPAPEGTVARLRHARVPTVRLGLAVLGVALTVALLTAALPAPLNLWAPVVLLAAVMGLCLGWGLRTERRAAG